MRAKIWLTPEHKKFRVKWTENRIQESLKWYRVIISDKKKFNLDGPDGYKYYWHNIKKEELSYIRLPECQPGVMVWGAISAYGKLKLIVIPGILNSIGYVSMLEDELLEFLSTHCDKDLVFMQDNAAVHTSKLSMQWFRENEVKLLPWPAKSPDLNPIENVWYLLSHKVYGGGKQYYNVEEITRAILRAWDEITQR